MALLRDTQEPRTPPVSTPTLKGPLTPGAAKMTIEAVDESAVNVEAVMEELLPWLKDEISSSESSNPWTPSPEIELGETFEFEEAAQIDPEPEQLNLRHEVADEADVVDAEHPSTLNIEIKDDRGLLSIAHQNYLNTGDRIASWYWETA